METFTSIRSNEQRHARLSARRRLLISRNSNRSDQVFVSRLRSIEREMRYVTFSLLRLRQLQGVQLLHAPNINDTNVHSTSGVHPPNVNCDNQSTVRTSTDVNVTTNTLRRMDWSNFAANTYQLRSRHRNIVARSTLGQPTSTCSHCNAVMWIEEKTRDSPKSRPKFTLCCKGGQVMLPSLPNTPEYLESQFRNARFKEHVRTYNSMLSFTSMGGKIDHTVLDGRGPYVFRISGANYHRIGSLLPDPGNAPKFAQLYIYDTEHEISNRLRCINSNGDNQIDQDTLARLQFMLDSTNPYVGVFRKARDTLTENDTNNLHVRILHSRDGRQYNRPTTNEIAALIIGDGSEDTNNRDIIIKKLDGTLKRIDETHPSYMPLQYPLLFPYGTDGWRRNIQFTLSSTNKNTGVSMREFYAYRLQFRDNEGKTILQGGRLFQQYVVDCYAAIEQQRLCYVRANQKKFRSDLFKGLMDAVNTGDTNAATVGRRYVLPSSFTGGPRNMIQHYQDAMAICRSIGFPDFFITFTCNPNWPEILHWVSMLPNQRTEDRPDIVARLFQLKLKQLMADFKKRKFFGETIADIHVIEFQKRGLPHSHIILTLAEDDKPRSPEEIDAIISAELPDEATDPLAFQTVLRCMIHGPCGAMNPNAPCIVNGKCSKGYPKKFVNETVVEETGFVLYRRRNTNKTYTVNGFDLDNRWVVPYNRDLIVKYNAHINIERCAQDKLIKYLYKYINKGPDRATIVIEDNATHHNNGGERQVQYVDEVKQYLDCRYVSSIEACWRIFKFDLQSQYPAVERLQYHLPDEQFIVFEEISDVGSLVNRDGIHDTMLTKWFTANMDHPDANNLTYIEFPKEWLWESTAKKWRRRRQRGSIGRLPYAPPSSGERYYIRMLLHKVRGANSFDDVKTFNGIVYPTFKAACMARGLVDNDNEWDEALNEASIWATGYQLRNMSCSILMFSEISDPTLLWEKHWCNLTDDLQNRTRREVVDLDMRLNNDDLKNLGLLEIEHILNKNGRSLSEFPPMPLPSSRAAEFVTNRVLREELDYDSANELQLFQSLHAGLNDDQLSVFNTIMESSLHQCGGLFFVYGSGGTGKTYLWKTLISKFRSDRKIVLSVASSGIASLLMPGGRTAHSRFKIPLNPDESSSCSICLRTDLASLIQETSLIIWDEAPMISRYAIEAVDRTFKDILKNTVNFSADRPFGGKLFVLGGDFRQILPVLPRSGREHIVGSSLPRSSIWKHCKVLHLKKNMRVSSDFVDEESRQTLLNFTEWIKLVGEGNIPSKSFGTDIEPNWIQIPEQFLIKNSETALRELISKTYPDLHTKFCDLTYLNERGILAPKNTDVDELNFIMLSMLPGSLKVYNSADKLCPSEEDGTDPAMYPPEFLNSLQFSGLPNHILQLKVGAPIILLRNLNQSLGLCNGTRLVITKMGEKVIEAKVITGSRIGEVVFINRVDLSPTVGSSPFMMKRRQFPIKLAFAMTINKSQGQTLRHVGLYLPNPVFSHGQLYVALSRVSSPTGLKILIKNPQGVPSDFTKNIVYKEVFNSIAT